MVQRVIYSTNGTPRQILDAYFSIVLHSDFNILVLVKVFMVF